MKVRYLIKFTKESNIKFISHLDMLRTIQRIVGKSGIDISYSKGFNPHMATAIAQPLSVGVYSLGDYMDIELESEMDEDKLIETLNEASPETIHFICAKKIPAPLKNEKKIPPSMALIDAAKYTIIIKYNNTDALSAELDKLFEKSEWITIKKTKKGEKEVDIKKLVKTIEYKIEEDKLVLNCLISCGSRENLSPDLLATFIKSNTTNFVEDGFVEIRREEMYTLQNDKLVELYNI